jgi:hypothetical protein
MTRIKTIANRIKTISLPRIYLTIILMSLLIAVIRG